MISVIIPTYNSEKYILECVYSVINQTHKDIEIIVIDDGSIDNTEKKLENLIKDGKIIFYKKNNGGPASARNLGIRKSSGDYIAFIDADDVWTENKIENQIDLIRKNNEPVVIYTDIFYINKEREREYDIYQGLIYEKLLKSNFITNSSVIIDRRIIRDVGLLNESEEMFGIEDYEYWLRISKKYKFVFLNKKLTGYRIHANQINSHTKKYQISNLLLKELIDNFPSKNTFSNIKHFIKMLIFEIIKK